MVRHARAVLDLYGCLFAPVAWIGAIHIVGGAAVLYAPKAVDVTQLAGVVTLAGRHPLPIGLTLVAVGVAAVLARMVEMPPRWRTAMAFPQQVMLLVQLIGVLGAAHNGIYPDGYVPIPGDTSGSAAFITGDQAALIVLCLSHTIEMFWLRAIPPLAQYEAMVAENLAMALELQGARRAMALHRQTEMWEDFTEEMKQEGRALA
jgi:hypothetical protein